MLKNKKIWFGVGVLAFIFCAFLVYANVLVLRFQDAIFSIDEVPTTTLALVFGGGMHSKTEMSEMQTDRVIMGVNLYKAGKVSKIMMTGDDGVPSGSDEIDAMRQYAIDQGVPSIDILVDPHGYRTYESCYRERHVYGVTSTIAVSQSFHLPRIIYFCKQFGIDTIGVSANVRTYTWWERIYSEVRETGARLKAWWQITVTKPLPRTLEK